MSAPKSLKLKAENKELAELKIVCLLKLKSLSEEIKRLKRKVRARTWAEWCLSRNSSNWLYLKGSKEKLFEEKTLIELEACGRLQKNGQSIKARTGKAESRSVELNRKCVKLLG